MIIQIFVDQKSLLTDCLPYFKFIKNLETALNLNIISDGLNNLEDIQEITNKRIYLLNRYQSCFKFKNVRLYFLISPHPDTQNAHILFLKINSEIHTRPALVFYISPTNIRCLIYRSL